MELDRELEQRVWQRVCHQPEIPDREGELARLISRRLGLAAEYARLSRQPSHRTAFARLEKTARKQAMCLMGLYRLGGAYAKISPLPPAGRQEHALRRCIAEELQFLQICAAETGPWMPVFEALGIQSRENLLALLEILGG